MLVLRMLGRQMLGQRPDLRFAVPTLPALRQQVQAAAQAAGFAPGDRALHLFEGQSHAVLAACDVALVASGTARLLARSSVVREAYLGGSQEGTTSAADAARRKSASATSASA